MEATKKHSETGVRTFTFAKDTKLTAVVSYVNDAPLLHTGTIVFEYEGCEFKSFDCAAFKQLLCMRNMWPLYMVELVNYLSRAYNDCNMFEVYMKRSTNVVDSEHSDEVVSKYIDGVCSDDYFYPYELQKHVNPTTPLVATSFDSFKHVPICGYVHPDLEIGDESIPFMHLAVVINVLSRHPAFPHLNNQFAAFAFASTLKAIRHHESVERLATSALPEVDRTARLRDENEALKRENANLMKKLEEQRENINLLTGDVMKLLQRMNHLATNEVH